MLGQHGGVCVKAPVIEAVVGGEEAGCPGQAVAGVGEVVGRSLVIV